MKINALSYRKIELFSRRAYSVTAFLSNATAIAVTGSDGFILRMGELPSLLSISHSVRVSEPQSSIVSSANCVSDDVMSEVSGGTSVIR